MAQGRKPPPPPTEEQMRKPATTPEGREAQIIAQAYDLVERQIEDGTVSAQALTHFIKRGSRYSQLEEELIAERVLSERAKREALAAEARTQELYDEAIKAMRSYAGHDPEPEEEEYDDDY